jgi:hypothetical protein
MLKQPYFFRIIAETNVRTTWEQHGMHLYGALQRLERRLTSEPVLLRNEIETIRQVLRQIISLLLIH